MMFQPHEKDQVQLKTKLNKTNRQKSKTKQNK